MDTLKKIKPVFVEPRRISEFAPVIQQFNAEVASPTSKGAVFLAVERGKVMYFFKTVK